MGNIICGTLLKEQLVNIIIKDKFICRGNIIREHCSENIIGGTKKFEHYYRTTLGKKLNIIWETLFVEHY